MSLHLQYEDQGNLARFPNFARVETSSLEIAQSDT
jgi:hypothetical protein